MIQICAATEGGQRWFHLYPNERIDHNDPLHWTGPYHNCAACHSRRQTKRTISPQTLVYYRENWYLDAWCHWRRDLRTFSLARITSLQKLDAEAQALSQQTLDDHFASSYGLFAGQPKYTATLRFLPAIAQEIVAQRWHPRQEGRWEGNDYILSFP